MQLTITFDGHDAAAKIKSTLCALFGLGGVVVSNNAAAEAPAADAPAGGKGKRGKKDDAPAVAAVETPTPAAAVAAVDTGGVTIEKIREKIIECTKLCGPKGAVSIVANVGGAAKASEVSGEKYPALLEALQEAIDAASVAG